MLKRLPAGSKLFTKFRYDGLNRLTKRYVGYDLAESTEPFKLTDPAATVTYLEFDDAGRRKTLVENYQSGSSSSSSSSAS